MSDSWYGAIERDRAYARREERIERAKESIKMSDTHSIWEIRSRLIDIASDLKDTTREMRRTVPRIGQSSPSDADTVRYRAALRASDQIQEAINELWTASDASLESAAVKRFEGTVQCLN